MQNTIQKDGKMEFEFTGQRDAVSRRVRVFSWEPVIFLLVLIGIFGVLGTYMGGVNLVNTMMNTAFRLLTDTVWYIMAIAVLAGALGALLTEFGVVALLNRILSPLVRPVYGMPGASMIGILTTFLSDNPAILTLTEDKNFLRYFKRYQVPALANVGTSFGMGLIVITYMTGLSRYSHESYIGASLVGLCGAIIGSIVSTRLMLCYTARKYGKEDPAIEGANETEQNENYRSIREGNTGQRFLDAILEGGKNGVTMGMTIIPGVLIICTFVMILTNGPSENGTFTGAAYEGVGFLPWVASKLGFVIKPLFGFTYDGAIAVPITALGSAGASIGMIPRMVARGLVSGNDIAVFASMCMCWSGYLSTHVAMMDSLKSSEMTGSAIKAHTIGGLCAGISAHLIYTAVTSLL